MYHNGVIDRCHIKTRPVCMLDASFHIRLWLKSHHRFSRVTNLSFSVQWISEAHSTRFRVRWGGCEQVEYMRNIVEILKLEGLNVCKIS